MGRRNGAVFALALSIATVSACSATRGGGGAGRPPGPAVSTGREPRASVSTGRQQRASVIRIISTNDFHGALEPRPDGTAGLRGGAAYVATAIARAAAECVAPTCASLLLDGGDLFQGTPASNLAFGRPVVEYYNALGYAATALGNHEFDWGVDSLRARMKQAHFGILGANVRYKDGRDVEWIRDDTIVERGGVKIGVVGIASTITPTSTKPANVADLRFDDPAPVIDAHARSLRARGADLIVVVEHDGAFCNADTGCRGDIINVAQKITEPVDAIVSGHTHSLVNTAVKGIPITQARMSGRAIAVMDIPLDHAARATAVREVRAVVTDSLASNTGITTLVQQASAAVAPIANRAVATVAEPIDGRGAQNALGNLIADAQRAAAKADVGVMNNGGIRTSLAAGPATYGSLFEIQPFGNVIERVTVRGADLRAYFERIVGRESLRAHISGAFVRFDSSKPAGSRVVSVTVGGAPLDNARTYTVAYTDFLASGGDDLSLSPVAVKTEPTNVVDLDALIDFVRSRQGAIKPDTVARLSRVAP